MTPRWLALPLMLLPSAAVLAQEPAVTVATPQHHGWWIGDVLPITATLRVDPGIDLDPSSLPRPGPVTYWLDLRSVAIERDAVEAGQRTIVLGLEYQTFYTPLEPKEMTVPAVPLDFVGGGGARSSLELSSWSFVTSPIREIMEASTPAAMAPDSRLSVIDTFPAQMRAAGGLVVCLLALLALAWHHGIGPFARRSRPLASAAGQVRRLMRKEQAESYRAALLVLHRALDATFERRLLADDVGTFLARRPRFGGLGEELSAFFSASRALFFGAGDGEAHRRMPPQDLVRLANRLAAAERGP